MLHDRYLGYLHGKKEKHQYIEEMYEFHRRLFEYPALINKPLSKIEISADQVLFIFDNDIRLCCDGRDAYSIPLSFLNLAAFETEENRMIYTLVKPGDVVFDVGANIGWYTINILRRHRGTQVHSFEPIDASYRFLLKNLALNKLETNRAHNIGLSDHAGTVKFYFDVECATASSMANLREDERTVEVECAITRLDDFVAATPELTRLDFIKCDVEGAELFVYRGGLESIKQFKPIVFSEMLRKWSKKFGYHPNDIIDLFRELEYDCYVIDHDRIQRFGRVDEGTTQTNYLFLHGQKHAETIRNLS
jgi:FkbM family methyltransferase